MKAGTLENHSTLELPYPRLTEGRFSLLTAYTDEALYDTCGVRIAFTTRKGGVSLPPYDGLNLGDHVADDKECVIQNRARLLKAMCSIGTDDLGLNVDMNLESSKVSYINPLQVHGDTVVVCENSDQLEACAILAKQGCDAVVACGPKIPVFLCFADCVPVIAVAPTGHFAVIHAGWRGVVNEISHKAISALIEKSECAPDSLNVYIGPYIHACHFEIAGEAVLRFNEVFGRNVFSDDSHVDMGAALRMTFKRAGISDKRVCDLDLCTVDNQDLFFSYRGSHGVCGRHGAYAFLEG